MKNRDSAGPSHREEHTPGRPDQNPVAASIKYLGAEDRGERGYFWKGRPISAKDAVIEANRLRKRRGEEQVGYPEWRVP